jgi:uncharacterized RDD family membrane protein YckC
MTIDELHVLVIALTIGGASMFIGGSLILNTGNLMGLVFMTFGFAVPVLTFVIMENTR